MTSLTELQSRPGGLLGNAVSTEDIIDLPDDEFEQAIEELRPDVGVVWTHLVRDMRNLQKKYGKKK